MTVSEQQPQASDLQVVVVSSHEDGDDDRDPQEGFLQRRRSHNHHHDSDERRASVHALRLEHLMALPPPQDARWQFFHSVSSVHPLDEDRNVSNIRGMDVAVPVAASAMTHFMMQPPLPQFPRNSLAALAMSPGLMMIQRGEAVAASATRPRGEDSSSSCPEEQQQQVDEEEDNDVTGRRRDDLRRRIVSMLQEVMEEIAQDE